MDNFFKTEVLTEEIRLAGDLIQELLKSKKQMRIYPPNNPMYIKEN